MTSELSCPQCKKKVLWNDTFPHRPFCSKRCQLIDLGEWANESFKIPATGGMEIDEFSEEGVDNENGY